MKTVRLPSVPARAGATLITGATLIDGTGAEPREGVDVEIRDGVIVSIGAPRPAATHPDLVIDAAGMFLMPGFVDTHVHLTMPNGARDEDMRVKFNEEHAFATADAMRQTLEAGVTAARDLSGMTPGYRNAVASGSIVGPRMHMSIALLSPTGGHADATRANGSTPHYVEWEQVPSWAVVDSDADVLRAVRQLVRTGADVIKICTTGGISTPHDSPEDLGIPESQVRLIVEELARRQGQPVAAHAQGREGAMHAVRGGVASLEHGYDLPDELIEEMLRRGTVLVPTLSTLHMTPDPAVKPAAVVAKKLEWQVRGKDAAARAIAAGVPIALGTDAGIHPHGRNLAELGHLVDAGMTPLQAITAGTLAGARLMGLDQHVGSIEHGKLADLVLTSFNPLTRTHDLASADAIRLVMIGGTIVKDLGGLAA